MASQSQVRSARILSGFPVFPPNRHVGGCENAKNFFINLLKGKEAPTVLVFMDEIEKNVRWCRN
jgi:hypothetical protein